MGGQSPFSKDSVVVISISGDTKEVVAAVDKAMNSGSGYRVCGEGRPVRSMKNQIIL